MAEILKRSLKLQEEALNRQVARHVEKILEPEK